MDNQKKVVLKEIENIKSIINSLELEVETYSYEEIMDSIGKLNTSLGLFMDDLKTL